jgi:hypothetical protein
MLISWAAWGAGKGKYELGKSFLKDRRSEKFVGQLAAGDTTFTSDFIPEALYTFALCILHSITFLGSKSQTHEAVSFSVFFS